MNNKTFVPGVPIREIIVYPKRIWINGTEFIEYLWENAEQAVIKTDYNFVINSNLIIKENKIEQN
jgi:hypothetical protein